MNIDDYHLIENEMLVGLAKVDLSGKFVKVNETFASFLGYSKSELLSKTYQEITHPHDVDYDEVMAQKLIDDPFIDEYTMTKRYLDKMSQWRWCRIKVVLQRDSKTNKPEYFISQILPIINNNNVDTNSINLVLDRVNAVFAINKDIKDTLETKIGKFITSNWQWLITCFFAIIIFCASVYADWNKISKFLDTSNPPKIRKDIGDTNKDN